MERRKGLGSLNFRCVRENPKELFQEKLMLSGGLKTHSTKCPGMIRTRVLDVEGGERYHYACPAHPNSM